MSARPMPHIVDNPAMNTSPEPERVAAALRALIARAEALPPGDLERHVQACAHELTAACVRRTGIRAAVDRMAAGVAQLQAALAQGSRRHEQHEAPAVERLLETLQEQLLPQLRKKGLL